MSTPEFSRVLDVRQCDRRDVVLEATPEECAALAERFELVRIDSLKATLSLTRMGDEVHADGTITARFVQSCAVSAEELPVSLSEPVALRFVPARPGTDADEDLEIDSDDPDEIEYPGTSIDLGEAIAQSLALAIDPFAVGPEAEEARARLEATRSSPFDVLASLKSKPKGGDA
ncbi:MAG: DUF177 domain-containing protein [Novosphingobium sp.]|nr:DUF177 domain-containing protein [Novosphingobium sp.]